MCKSFLQLVKIKQNLTERQITKVPSLPHFMPWSWRFAPMAIPQPRAVLSEAVGQNDVLFLPWNHSRATHYTQTLHDTRYTSVECVSGFQAFFTQTYTNPHFEPTQHKNLQYTLSKLSRDLE